MDTESFDYKKYGYFKNKAGNVLKSDKVIITRPLADKLNINPKDTIKSVNRLDSKEYSITIDDIAETYVGSYTGLWSTTF